MSRVIIESPFAGAIDLNLVYLQQCLRFALLEGHAPFASHMLYTCALDDSRIGERDIGIAAGLTWGHVADQVWVFIDRGISRGMRVGIADALTRGTPVRVFAFAPDDVPGDLLVDIVELFRGVVLLTPDTGILERATLRPLPPRGELAASELGHALTPYG